MNIAANADEDLATVEASLSGGDLRAAFAHNVRKCEYLVISACKKNHLDLNGTFVKQYKTLARKKVVRVADSCRDTAAILSLLATLEMCRAAEGVWNRH